LVNQLLARAVSATRATETRALKNLMTREVDGVLVRGWDNDAGICRVRVFGTSWEKLERRGWGILKRK